MRSRLSAFVLLVAAISVVAGSGRKPAKEQQATVSLRRLSGNEVMDILNKFPEMVPDYLASRRTDQAYLAQVFRLSELTATILDRVFPTARFYKGLDMALPPHPYLMATAGGKRHPMPSGLNLLLLDNGLKVTDENMLELAKIFVTLAVGNDGYAYPKVSFMETTRTSKVMDGTPYQARLQVRVGEQIEDWYFGVLDSQLSFVARRGAKGLIKNYLPSVVESFPGRGQLNSPTPDMAIEAPMKVDKQAERDSMGAGPAPAGKPELESTASSARMLTDAEAAQVSQRFPALGVRPGGISLVSDDLLGRPFPKAAFYKILDRSGRPTFPYLIAIIGDSVFPVPSGFNLLMREQGVEVTDDNIVDLAKAFVIIAIADQPPATPIDEFSPLNSIPRVTFLGGQRIEQRDLRNPYGVDVQITCRVDSGETQTWSFSQGRDKTSEGVRVKVGQFGAVRVAIGGKPIWEYQPVNAEEETRRGAAGGSE